MSVCAVMVARDEADIVEAAVLHALWHVDELIAADHRSVDGTREILESLPVTLLTVKERGFDGDSIWTWLAAEAFSRGHDWLLVNDADDVWYPTLTPRQSIRHYLDAMPPDVLVVSADSFNHVPTAADNPDEPNPLLRINWRKNDADSRKVACRLRADFSYSQHNGWYGREVAEPTVTRGLTVRHYTIRTADQLVRKVRNGLDAFSVEAGMPPEFDYAWAQWRGLDDDDIREQFYSRFWSDDPRMDDTLVYDPSPVREAVV